MFFDRPRNSAAAETDRGFWTRRYIRRFPLEIHWGPVVGNIIGPLLKGRFRWKLGENERSRVEGKFGRIETDLAWVSR